MLVAEIAVLTATALAAMLAAKSSWPPRILMLQSLALTVIELPKLLYLEPQLTIIYLTASIAHVAVPPILLTSLARTIGGHAERAPTLLAAAASFLAATTITIALIGGPRTPLYALASLLPILIVVYSRDPIRVAVSLNMASNALHPLIVTEGTIAYAAISNISITMVVYVAYLLTKEGWKTYGSASLQGWDRWLKR